MAPRKPRSRRVPYWLDAVEASEVADFLPSVSPPSDSPLSPYPPSDDDDDDSCDLDISTYKHHHHHSPDALQIHLEFFYSFNNTAQFIYDYGVDLINEVLDDFPDFKELRNPAGFLRASVKKLHLVRRQESRRTALDRHAQNQRVGRGRSED